MTLIEGVGDEVTYFFLVIIVVLVGVISWWSTNIADQPLIRTVLILERRTRRRATTEPTSTPPTTTTTTTVENSIDTGQLEATVPGNDSQQELESGAACQICDKESTNISATSTSSALNNEQNTEVSETSSPVVDESSGSRENLQPCRRDQDLTEDGNRSNTSLLNDPESSVLRNRRLIFFQNRQVTLLDSPIADEISAIPICREATEVSNSRSQADGSRISTDSSDDAPSAGSIRIRLKYLNDDQKLVEGKLQEQLGDFKRRHFGLELSADKLVRLIFNGQILQRDSETLQGYGLFDNCVVHCLVHQHSSNQGGSTENQAAHDSGDAAHHRDWDLGNVLFASLSLLLGLAWFCRYQYAQLFNATTTVALLGLTGILVISIVGMYVPDQDDLRH